MEAEGVGARNRRVVPIRHAGVVPRSHVVCQCAHEYEIICSGVQTLLDLTLCDLERSDSRSPTFQA